ncbi:MAG: hypothetical protein AB8I08_12000 [Sandaracinaceae bacterium]
MTRPLGFVVGLAFAGSLVCTPVLAQEVGVSTAGSEEEPEVGVASEEEPEVGVASEEEPEVGVASEEEPEVGVASEEEPEVGVATGEEPEVGVATGEEPEVAVASEEEPAEVAVASEEEPAPRTEAEVPQNPFGESPRVALPPAPTNDRASTGGSDEVREEGEEPTLARRDVPRYDGRTAPTATVEEGLLWIPRVLFFPVHLVLEYVFRQPIGWFLTTMERERWHVLFIDFFTWDERNAGIVPTTLWDFGFVPAVGLYFFWNDAFVEGNDIRAQVGFGGPEWLRATLVDRARLTDQFELGVTVDAWRRPDQIFEGIGWDSSVSRRSRFFRNYVDGRVDLRFRPWRESEVRFGAGVIWNDFAQNGFNPDIEEGDPSLEQAIAQGFYDAPPGIEGYTAYYQRLDVVVDSREARPAPGHGVRVEGFVHQGFDLNSVTERRWMRYGGALGGYLDVSEQRVLSLSATFRFAEPLGTSSPVPFTELASLGNESVVMSGFLQGQLVGRSATAVTLEYRYPIWVFLDGSLHASIGNVFGERFSDFDFDRLRASFGFGFRSSGDRDQAFDVLLAFGTAPFVEGGGVESVRLVLGSRQGF